MKKIRFAVIGLFMMTGMASSAENYSALWKQYKTAVQKDLPKTAINVLQQIEQQAKSEQRYGDLLSASINRARLQVNISRDSINSEVARIERSEREAREKDAVLAAVYQSALGQICREIHKEGDDWDAKSNDYLNRSLQNIQILAATTAKDYEPLLQRGVDSKLFNNDLLHVLGMVAGKYKLLHDYYLAQGNRAAACICAAWLADENERDDEQQLRKSHYIQQIDSLINVYSDLPEAGELALMRYRFMATADDVSTEQQIQYINYALSKWGTWKGLNELRNAYKDLTNPNFSVTLNNTTIPGKAFMAQLDEVRNVNSVNLRVWRLAVAGDYNGNVEDAKDYAALKKRMTAVPEASAVRRYLGLPDYQVTRDSIEVAALPVGVYLLEFATDNKNVSPIRSLLYVSNLVPLLEAQPNKTVRIAVVNATTGHPVPGAKVRLNVYHNDKDKWKTETLTCGNNGEVMYRYERYSPDDIYVYTANDKAFKQCSYNTSYGYYSSSKNGAENYVYTDRSIYRPGQTVHVAAILFRKGNDLERRAAAGEKIKLTLRDANYKVVEEKEVVADAYGKAYTDFTLPSKGLTGTFSIYGYYGHSTRTTFRVEEYKRPTFEVSFPEVNQKYAVGDTVVVTGHAKTYAGVPVQGAKVSYTVRRNTAFWWWRYSNYNDNSVVRTDTVTTDESGAFKVEVPMELPKGKKDAGFYSFEVLATVTDLGGESRQGSMSLPLGSKPTSLTSNIPDKSEKDSLKTVTFIYKNAAGADLNGNVRYYINNVEAAQTAKTNTPVALDVSALPTGKHQLKAICGTDTLTQDFILFSMQDVRPVVDTTLWSYQSARTFRLDGRPVYVQLGSSQDSLCVFYSIFSGNKVLESGTKRISNSLLTEQFTWKPEYGDGILLTYGWVKDGEFYSQNFSITRATTDKRLVAEWKTFRDKLTPGQKEEWTLTVKHPDGRPADAQVMATMYDKSLEQIAKHGWTLNLGYWFNLPSARWQTGLDRSRNSYESSMAYRSLTVDGMSFYHFNPGDFDWYDSNSWYEPIVFGYAKPEKRLMIRGTRVASATSGENELGEFEISSQASVKKMSMTGSVMAKDEVAKESAEPTVAEPNEDNMQANNVSVRENLNETAFFYPALTTDENGEIAIKFTLPESITTWRFMALATDKEMNNGTLDAEAVAKKTLMIQPNMPRFMRLGDKGVIAAKLFNTYENDVTGVARLELRNPETDKTVFVVTRKYAVKANETGSIDFEIDFSQGSTLYAAGANVWICRITAVGKGYNDGEQHYLPVLPDREAVTNSIAFTQNTPGIKTINLEKLFAVKDPNNRLTVEYTENPAWLTIQALPYVSEVDNDNAISLATAYYANSIARSLLTHAPFIKNTIEQWRSELGYETSLTSDLQKNEELKLLVLDETPWIRDAAKETEQKQALIRYFDENSINDRLSSCIEKLRKLQNGDGSWSWYPGMRGSSYVTMAVAEMLVRLQSMIGQQDEYDELIRRSFIFMNREIKKEVKQMKVDEKKGLKVRPSEWAVRYLYISSLTDKALHKVIDAERSYMVDKLSQQTIDFTIYGKAISAVILAKNGHVAQGKEYLQSIREYMVYKEEMGSYFETPKAYYSWFDYKIPTQVAAIEAIKAIDPTDTQTIDNMKRWLLQEKRTQIWDTPINSVNAVYAFLQGNIETLKQVETSPVKLTVNGKQLDLPKATAGLGYIKTTETGSNFKTFTANKTSNGTSWGAVYAQFMQKATDIADASMGLTVTRELLHNGSLKVGDKVKVRITIVAERDFDFVQIVDKRAACMEPVGQLSGYRNGYYCTPRDNATCYYADAMPKGKHVIETEYYIDRRGTFNTGTCTVQCAYSPAYMARTKAQTLIVK